MLERLIAQEDIFMREKILEYGQIIHVPIDSVRPVELNGIGNTIREIQRKYLKANTGGKMPFDNDDLKRLRQKIQGEPFLTWSNADLAALLARLEASERLLDLWLQLDDECEIDGSVFDKAMETWRKSMAKSND